MVATSWAPAYGLGNGATRVTAAYVVDGPLDNWFAQALLPVSCTPLTTWLMGAAGYTPPPRSKTAWAPELGQLWPPVVPQVETGVARAAVIMSADGAGSLELAPSFSILHIVYSGAARLRLYRTQAGRDADTERPVTEPCPKGRGLLYEYVATEAGLDGKGSVAGSSELGSTVHYRVDGGPVDITITWIRSEA